MKTTWEYLIVRNNKAPVRSVFEYLRIETLRAPSENQKRLLSMICDRIEFIKAGSNKSAMRLLNKGDELYDLVGEFPTFLSK